MSNLKIEKMEEDLEKEIERIKQKLDDYIRLAKVLNIKKKEQEIQINMMLDDLSKLMKKREKKD